MAGTVTAEIPGEVTLEDCSYCVGSHLPWDMCPVLRQKLWVVDHQEELTLAEYDSQFRNEMINIDTADSETWENFRVKTEERLRQIKLFYEDRRAIIHKSLKTDANFKRAVNNDVIQALDEDDDEKTQTCVFCPEFHISSNCPKYIKKREELLRVRGEKIVTWAREMNFESTLIQDNNPKIWDDFKRTHFAKFASMYIMQRAEETQVIRNMRTEAALYRGFMTEDPSLDHQTE